VIDINLVAVVDGTRLGFLYMTKNQNSESGVIINVASMAGLLPTPETPVYAASKFGVVGFCRSLSNPSSAAPTTKTVRSVRVNAICPTFVETPMVKAARDHIPNFPPGAIVSVGLVVDGMLQLIQDDTKSGAVMRITTQKGIDYAPDLAVPPLHPAQTRTVSSKL